MQKALLASLTIMGASLSGCERPAAAASSPDPSPVQSADTPEPAATSDFSKFQTADALWSHLESRVEQAGNLQSEKDAIAFLTPMAGGMEDFIARFPKDERITEARLNKVQYALILDQLGAPYAPPAQIMEELRGVIADSATPAQEKQTARLMLLNLLAMNGSAKEYIQAAEEFQRDYPGQSLPGGLQIVLLDKLMEADPAGAKKAIAEATRSNDPNVARIAEDYQRWLPLLGKPFNLKFTAVDGREIDTAKMRGNVILIDFWATWCAPCLQSIPETVEIYKKYHDQGFDVLGISLDQDKDQMLALIKAAGMTWPQYFDGLFYDNKISSSFGITAIPQMWLVDKKGNLASISARIGLEPQVKRLLAE